jgi:hypothetical protein
VPLAVTMRTAISDSSRHCRSVCASSFSILPEAPVGRRNCWIPVALRPAPTPPCFPSGPPGASCSGPSGLSLDPPVCPPVPLALGVSWQQCGLWCGHSYSLVWCLGAPRPLPLYFSCSACMHACIAAAMHVD